MVITGMRNEKWLEVAYRISHSLSWYCVIGKVKNGLNLALSVELMR